MTPDSVSGKSGKKAHFICSNNSRHRWEVKIFQRTHRDTGENIDCPYCLGRLAFEGETDFFTKCPEAKEFWDYDTNFDIEPTQLLPTSSKKANFKCLRGHKFTRHIYNFTKSPKCPDCYLIDNNITVTHPHIAAMWDYKKNAPLTPDQFLKTNKNKVWWKCNKEGCGYSWESEIVSRTSSKGLCPSCEVNIVFTPGVNDLETKDKKILKYWDYEKNTSNPSEINFYDDRKFHWICPDCGYEWKSLIQYRVKYIKGERRYVSCPSCNGNHATEGRTDISTTHPELAIEYVPELNTIPLSEIRAGTNKPIYWKCSVCNQIFPAQPNSRTRYNDHNLHGCPYCAGKLPIKGVNDFKSLQPELSEEWDYGFNELSPKDYTCGSNVVVNWKCKNDKSHSRWTASINTRSNGYAKCPDCSRIAEGDRLSDLHPELLKYWDYDRNEKGPEYYTEFSNETVWWICDENHSYPMEIYQYTRNRFYCPVCLGTRLIKGVNDLATLYPEFLDIWDYEKNDKTPYEITFTPSVPYYYKCNNHNHIWRNKIGRVIESNFSCDYCSNRRVLPEFNSLQAHYPEIAFEWVNDLNNTTPDAIFPINAEYRRWHCHECGQIFSATTKGRTEGTENCPYCGEIKAIPGVNSFAALHPNLLKYFSNDNQYNPDLVFPSYKKRTIWDCDEYDLQWAAPLNDVVEGRRECPYCSGQKAVPGITSLKAIHPELAKAYYEGNPLSSDHILPSYGEYVFWVCNEYRMIYNARVRDMVDGTAECPYCSGKTAVPGVNSLAALHPKIAQDLKDNKYSADEILPTLTSSLEWKCHIYNLPYTATPRGLVEGTESCPYCYERRVVPGVNSLSALYPDLIENEWKYLSNILLVNPNEIFPTASTPQCFWECPECGTTYKASPKGRTQNLIRGIESCPTCKGLRQKFINY